LPNQCFAESAVAVLRNDSDILNGTVPETLDDPLHRATATLFACYKPSGSAEKGGFPANLPQKMHACGAVAEGGKQPDINRRGKRAIVNLGMQFQQRLIPGHPEIPLRQPRRRWDLPQFDVHLEALEVSDAHGSESRRICVDSNRSKGSSAKDLWEGGCNSENAGREVAHITESQPGPLSLLRRRKGLLGPRIAARPRCWSAGAALRSLWHSWKRHRRGRAAAESGRRCDDRRARPGRRHRPEGRPPLRPRPVRRSCRARQ